VTTHGTRWVVLRYLVCTVHMFILSSCSGSGGSVDDAVVEEDQGGQCPPYAECCKDSNCVGFGEQCSGQVCVEGKCVTEHEASGTACDDENECTMDDKCDGNGKCTGKVAKGMECDDGSLCTTGDHCDQSGICVGTENVTCTDDGNSCTVEVCEAEAGCVSRPADLQPNDCDGDLCTAGDSCQVDGDSATCVPGLEKECPVPGQCKTSFCHTDTGSCETEAKDDGAACDDGDNCTDGESCLGGECQTGEPKECDDKNPCTIDNCDQKVGCKFDPVPLDLQKPCDDGDKCTSGDICKTGVCKGEPKDCSDGNPCTDDQCESETGCYQVPSEGQTCDDGDACTVGDTCTALEEGDGIECKGDAMACDDGKPCTDDSCDDQEGCQFDPMIDGSKCILPGGEEGACLGGECAPLPCVPSCGGKQCGDDGCGGECGPCPNGEPCIDGACGCVPDCAGKQCGPSGNCPGVVCGQCDANSACVDGLCVCMFNDPCGETCCATGQVCNQGVCCTPQCDGKDCGDNACGGTCGECFVGEACKSGVCKLEPTTFAVSVGGTGNDYGVGGALQEDGTSIIVGREAYNKRAFVAKLDKAGALVWQKSIDDMCCGGSLQDLATGVDAVAVAGAYGEGNNVGFVAKLNLAGELFWQSRYGRSHGASCAIPNSNHLMLHAIEAVPLHVGLPLVVGRLTAAGDVAWSKTFSTIEVGLTADIECGAQAAFVVAPSPAAPLVVSIPYEEAAPNWVVSIGEGEFIPYSSVALAQSGVAVAGLLPEQGKGDVGIVLLQPDGKLEAAWSLGNPDVWEGVDDFFSKDATADETRGVDLKQAPNGDLILATTVYAWGSKDIMVARLTTALTLVWSRRFGDSLSDEWVFKGNPLSVGTGGDILVVGTRKTSQPAETKLWVLKLSPEGQLQADCPWVKSHDVELKPLATVVKPVDAQASNGGLGKSTTDYAINPGIFAADAECGGK